MTTLFIADLHLTPNRPDITDCFLRFMADEAAQADKLYILGDLFEFWIGDEDDSEFADTVRGAIKAVSEQGVQTYFVQGNRDFLLGEKFCRQTGMTLLSDVSTMDLYGRQCAILHGDTLCIDDIKYQEFRKTVHQPWLQWVFKRIPWFIKKKIVRKVQSDIRDDKKTKSMAIMDVNQGEVERVLEQLNVDLMIHGHTHRPDVHTFLVNETEATRVVLGDWFTQGSVLKVNSDGFSLETRPFSANT